MTGDVQAYLNAVPAKRSIRIMAIHKLIMRLYPDIMVDMSYNMPTYRLGEGWVALANQRNYISLYTCGASHLAPYKKKHPQQKTGKGCINFRARDEIHYDDLETVIKHAIEHPKE